MSLSLKEELFYSLNRMLCDSDCRKFLKADLRKKEDFVSVFLPDAGIFVCVKHLHRIGKINKYLNGYSSDL